MRLRIPSKRDEALDASIQRPRQIDLATGLLKEPPRGVVAAQRAPVLAAHEADVSFGAEALRARALVIEPVGDPARGEREMIRLPHVDAREPDHAPVQVVDRGGLQQIGPRPQKSRTRRGRRQVRQPPGERVRHVQKPLAARKRSRRLRHRPRMKPIEPVARPSVCATSRYGSGGSR